MGSTRPSGTADERTDQRTDERTGEPASEPTGAGTRRPREAEAERSAPGAGRGQRAETHREQVLTGLQQAEREFSAVAVMFHQAVASRRGLSATETKTLDMLERGGPLTAKDLAARSGLAPASVTGLVDRLERKGYVRRVPHPTDKRRVLVELRPEGRADLLPLFLDFAREAVELHKEFSTGELELIDRYLRSAADRQRRAAARLEQDLEEGSDQD